MAVDERGKRRLVYCGVQFNGGVGGGGGRDYDGAGVLIGGWERWST